MTDWRYSLAAVTGAVLQVLRTPAPWPRRAVLLCSGYGFAMWVGPAFIDPLKITTPEQTFAYGFACGYLGDFLLSVGSTWMERAIKRHLATLLDNGSKNDRQGDC